MLNRLIDKVTDYVLLLVSKLNTFKTSENIEEDIENNEEVEYCEEKKKVFNVKSIFDTIDKIGVEIMPFKMYLPDEFSSLSEQLDKVRQKCELYYKDDSSSNYLTVGINPERDFEIITEIRDLEEKIRKIKKSKFNYIYVNDKFEKLLNVLDRYYFKNIVDPQEKNCISAENSFSKIMEEAENLEFEEDILKTEEIQSKITKIVYYIHKYKVWCGHKTDELLEKYFEDEYSNFVKIFLDEVEVLIKKTEVFKKNKNYRIIKEYYKKLLSTVGHPLKDYEFFHKFLEKEKKTLELEYLYANCKNSEESIEESKICNDTTDSDIFTVSSLIEYLKNILKEDSASYDRLYYLVYFLDILNSTIDKITNYEVYKLISIFKLKIFISRNIKGNEDDLMHKLFMSQKGVIIDFKSTDDEKVIMKSINNIDNISDMLNSFGIKSRVVEIGLYNFLMVSIDFSDCPNIMMALEKL